MANSNGQWAPPPAQGPWGQPPQQPVGAPPPGYPQQAAQPPTAAPQQTWQQPVAAPPPAAAPAAAPQQTWQQPVGVPPPGYWGQQPAAAPQPNFNANPFAGMTSGDQTGSRRPYLEDGYYKLLIQANKYKPARSGKQLYITEVRITASNVAARPVGMECSCFIDMGNMDMRGKNLSALASAVYGFDPKKLPKDSVIAPWNDPQYQRPLRWDEYALMSIGDNQPWVGREVGCHVTTIDTKGGGEFSLHEWAPAEGFVIPAPAPQVQQAAPPPGAQLGQQPYIPPGQSPPAGWAPAQQPPATVAAPTPGWTPPGAPPGGVAGPWGQLPR